jgi:hypothetical protein
VRKKRRASENEAMFPSSEMDFETCSLINPALARRYRVVPIPGRHARGAPLRLATDQRLRGKARANLEAKLSLLLGQKAQLESARGRADRARFREILERDYTDSSSLSLVVQVIDAPPEPADRPGAQPAQNVLERRFVPLVVLLIDRDASRAKDFCALLSDHGLEAHHAETIAKGLKCLQPPRPLEPGLVVVADGLVKDWEGVQAKFGFATSAPVILLSEIDPGKACEQCSRAHAPNGKP